MEQVRVNLSLEQEGWERFSALVPNRKRSKIINELLKKELKNIARYYLGACHARRGKNEKARKILEELIADKPKEDILKVTRDLLEQVKKAPPERKKWSFYLSSGFQYDTNASLRPEDTDLYYPFQKRWRQ